MLNGSGGFAEYSITDALTCVVLPKNIHQTNEDKPLIHKLSASPCAAWTAFKGMQDQLGIEIGKNHL